MKVELDLFGRSLLGPNAFRGPITLYRARIHLAEREIRGIGEMLVFIADGGSKKLVVAPVMRGKNVAVVLEDADLDMAAATVASAAVIAGGGRPGRRWRTAATSSRP